MKEPISKLENLCLHFCQDGFWVRDLNTRTEYKYTWEGKYAGLKRSLDDNRRE